jgi:hypothetical protein
MSSREMLLLCACEVNVRALTLFCVTFHDTSDNCHIEALFVYDPSWLTTKGVGSSVSSFFILSNSLLVQLSIS